MKFNTLLENYKKKKITIGILGIGYVGLKLLIQFANKKFQIIGFDRDLRKINLLKKNFSPISYIDSSEIKKIKNFTSYESNFFKVKECNVIILCLPTPLKNKKPDLSHILKSINKIKKYLKEYQLIVLESTTYPGTTEEKIKPILDKTFSVGKNFFLGYSPERENPGDNKFKFKKIPKICSGYSNNCIKLSTILYKHIVDKVVPAKNIKEAEFAKLMENIYRSVNISMVNEMKMISHKMDINFNNVLNLASTKPFGFKKFVPGPGVGGHCIPIDPYYLSWKAKQHNISAKFIKLAGKINEETTEWIYKKVLEIIKFYKIKNNFFNILIIGLAYKKNIEDTRESAAIKLYQKFYKKNLKIDYFDPYVKSEKIKLAKIHKKIISIKLNKEKIKKYDIVILVTDHDNLDYNLIKNHSKILIDTRNRVFRKKNFFSL